jgi:hypothetical protein
MAHAEPTLRRFVLQALDPVMDYPALEARFQIEELSGLHVILADDAEGDYELRRGYTLDANQLAAIKSLCGVEFDPGDRPVGLVPWRSIREAPYLIHTGFELPLMLDGRKPLSKFADAYPSEWLDDVAARFQPFVDDGRIVCRVVDEVWPTPGRLRDQRMVAGHREIFFTLPGQEWRVDAHRLLYEVGSKIRWNDTLERLEGRLWGYEEWQNDWWLGRGVLSWQRTQDTSA